MPRVCLSARSRADLEEISEGIGFYDLRDENGENLGNYRAIFPPSSGPPFKGQIYSAMSSASVDVALW